MRALTAGTRAKRMRSASGSVCSTPRHTGCRLQPLACELEGASLCGTSSSSALREEIRAEREEARRREEMRADARVAADGRPSAIPAAEAPVATPEAAPGLGCCSSPSRLSSSVLPPRERWRSTLTPPPAARSTPTCGRDGRDGSGGAAVATAASARRRLWGPHRAEGHEALEKQPRAKVAQARGWCAEGGEPVEREPREPDHNVEIMARERHGVHLGHHDDDL